jgi:hypothetical protein
MRITHGAADPAIVRLAVGEATRTSQAYNLVNAAVPAVPLVEPDTQNVGDGSIKGWGAYPNPIVYYANLHR